MLKKIISLGITFLLTACSLGSEQVEIPAEYAGAHYQLSESDAERWALASDQAERCIYPNLTRFYQKHPSNLLPHRHKSHPLLGRLVRKLKPWLAPVYLYLYRFSSRFRGRI